jgi:DNA-binding transcriptional LysR family regulator
LVCSRNHRLANRAAVEIDDLSHERFVFVRQDEEHGRILLQMRDRGLRLTNCHETSCESDLMQLLADNLGVAVLPRSLIAPESLVQLPVAGLDFRRTVRLYAMSGRERTVPAATFVRLLRGANWSRHVGS